jgi:hypothetical protein
LAVNTQVVETITVRDPKLRPGVCRRAAIRTACTIFGCTIAGILNLLLLPMVNAKLHAHGLIAAADSRGPVLDCPVSAQVAVADRRLAGDTRASR